MCETLKKCPLCNGNIIVYLIPSMSHSLFSKVQNTNSLNDVRRIYCNNRSVNNVLLNIYTALMDE